MLIIVRNTTPIATVDIDKSTVYNHVVMGEHRIAANFITAAPIDLRVDDYVEFRGQQFEVNQDPAVYKLNNFTYRYECFFESLIYRLLNKVFMDEGSIEFSYFGTPAEYIQLLVNNMNEIDSGWTVGQVDDSDPIHINFVNGAEGYSCRTALTYIAERLRLEYWLDGKAINLTKMAGVQTNLDFEYGKGKGLYSISRLANEDVKLVNRLYVYGGTKNISYTYRDGAKRLVIPDRFIERPLLEGEKRREGSIIFDDIYPHRTGTVMTIEGDGLGFTDSSIDFDLNGQKIDGETAKVTFTSGELSGKEFEIASYDHTTKSVNLVKLVEQDGYELPNATFGIQNGDQYVFTGIIMPETYETTAETDLLDKGTEYFNTQYRLPYEIGIHDKFVRDNGIQLNAGDRVRIKDAALGIDDNIRVTSVSFPLVDEAEITAVVADSVPYTIQERTVIDQALTKREIKVVDRTKSEMARQNMLRVRRLQEYTFDPDGYFDTERIKPLSIETGMLSVGAKSQNFGLNAVSINANTGGDPNHLTISSGTLVHYEVEIEGLGYVWALSAGDFAGLDPVKHYYLSARCSRSALTGGWHLSEMPVKAEDETGWWHFNVGILYPVADGSRGFDFTKGMTFIVGDRITTGRIQSLDGLNFFDLSQAQFKLGDSVSGLDWNVTNEGVLTIRGAVASDVILVGSDGYINAGISGVSEAGAQSVRQWAGADFADRATAPFHVKQDGTGQIGGFKFGTGSMESANEYNGGRFVLYPNSGYIAFLNSPESVWAGIGENVLPSSSGLRAVGRFENKKSDVLANYGITIDVQGSAVANIALKANGNIAVDGALTTTNLYKFVPTLTNNTLSIAWSNTALVLVNNASYYTVYLPEVSEIVQALGITTGADFAVRYTVIAHYTSLDLELASGETMRDSNGNVITSVTMSKGDQTYWLIYRESGTVTAQIMNRQWE